MSQLKNKNVRNLKNIVHIAVHYYYYYYYNYKINEWQRVSVNLIDKRFLSFKPSKTA